MSFFGSDDEDDNDRSILTPQGGNGANDPTMTISQPYDDQLIKTKSLVNMQMNKANELQKTLKYPIKNPVKKQMQVIDPSYENSIGVFNLIESPEKEFGKIITTFSYLDHEISKNVSQFENKFIIPLLSYGQGSDIENA